jgi:nucleotide-binding universal stress UspA family protein
MNMENEMATQSTVTAPTVYLVAVDGTPSSSQVIEKAAGLVAALGGAAELHVVHVLAGTQTTSIMGMAPVVPPETLLEAGRTVLDTACTEAKARFQGKIAGHLAAGEPWREITQLASNLRADLVVVGTAGRTGLARLALGSAAEKVVRNAGCPVLVVRPKDFHTTAVPEIEPPCPDCVKVQDESARAKLWCARHETHHAPGRLHYELPPTFAMGSMLVRPSS